MDRLGTEIRRELGRFGPAAGMAELVAAWPAAVGEAIARNAWPARIARDGTLHIATSSSTWAFELGQLAPTISAKLVETLGPEVAPRALRFAAGRLPEAQPPTAERSREPVPAATPEQAAEAERLVATIEDAELRELVARAARASLAKTAADRRF